MRLIIFFLAMLLPIGVAAQPVTIRSGEHTGFTRLVFGMPGPFSHAISRTERGYRLTFKDGPFDFDVAQVFRAIGRQRLAAIETSTARDGLSLTIGCACHVVDSLVGERYLVVDIKDGPPPPDSPHELSSDGIRLDPLVMQDARVMPGPSSATESTRHSSGYNWLLSRPVSQDEQGPIVTDRFGEDSPQLTALRKTLLEQITRSADASEVTLRPTLREGGEVLSLVSQNDTEVLGLAIAGEASVTAEGITCASDNELDIAAWAPAETQTNPHDLDILSLFAQSRNKFLSEFDSVDPDALQRTARLYLYFGFGAEARALLSAFGQKEEANPQLWSLTFLVDGEPAPNDAFAGQAGCPGRAALWGLLSETGSQQSNAVSTSAVVQNFLILPPYLQATVGPALMIRLQEAGASSEADLVASALARLATFRKEVRALAIADLALRQNRPDDAEASLANVQDMHMTADQAILTAELAWSRKTPLSQENLTLLEAYAFSESAGPAGKSLARALSKARAMAGQAKEALALAPDPETRRDIWHYLVAEAPDSVFLDIAATATGVDRTDLPQGLRARITSRLVDLGVPVLAADWLPTPNARPMLAARLALLKGDAAESLDWLSTEAGQEADHLRLEAYKRLGQYERAADLMERLGDLPGAAALQLIHANTAGADLRLPSGPDGAQLNAAPEPWQAILAETQATPLTTPLPSLAMSQTLLERSRRTRDVIEGVRKAWPLP